MSPQGSPVVTDQVPELCVPTDTTADVVTNAVAEDKTWTASVSPETTGVIVPAVALFFISVMQPEHAATLGHVKPVPPNITALLVIAVFISTSV